MGTNGRIGRYLGYLHAKTDLGPYVIPNSTEEDIEIWKVCGVLRFGGIQLLACRAISASAELS